MVGIETTITKKGKKGIKKIYCEAIEGYGAEDFRPFFENRIDSSTKIKTDRWTGYLPLKKNYKIRIVYSKKGKNFKELHNVILNLKGWLRGIHHSVCNWHFQGYLDEFSFRYNYKNDLKTGWEILVENMVAHTPVYAKNLFYGS